ncbi:hypothetical protein [Nocardia wallacei]|uniref:hypothetical protein n=1 Tax=Nocardia wallacei TaxID=480035 RepID=UPI00245802DB|nr:hypothetical protein [Nocardia wallacei]
MTLFVDDDTVPPEFGQWLTQQREQVAADLRQVLDVEAGLQEILIGAHRAELKNQIRSIVDIEAGLAAIVPAPDPILVLDNDVDNSDLDQVLRAITPADRLSLREAFAPLVGDADTLRIASGAAAAGEELTRVAWELFDQPYQDRWIQALELNLSSIRAGLSILTGSLADCTTSTPHADSVFSRVGWRLLSEAGDLHDLLNNFCDLLGAGPWTRGEPGEITIAANCLRASIQRSAARLRSLYRYLNDFVGADLSDVELEGMTLVGVRWSCETVWPPDWQERIENSSVEVEPGVYEIGGDGSRQRDLVH